MIRFGITTMATEPPARFGELVELVEMGGFDELWVCDSSLHARDVYPYLTLVAVGSTRLRFGPNCTHPYTRHPGITANAVATLQELSGGRALVALGAGDRPVMELGARMAPTGALREMVAGIRRLMAGEIVDSAQPFAFQGARLPVSLASPPPVYLAASGPRMLELGGEIADGVLFLSGVHPACVEYALARIEAGARRAGRTREALDVVCTVAGSLREDVALARRECIPMAAWFPQTAPVYAALAEVDAETRDAIRRAYAGGHFDAARRAFAHVTDPMIDRFTVAGDVSLWEDRIKALVALGIRHINIFLLSADKHAMVRDLAAHVLPQFRSPRAVSTDPAARPSPPRT
jgi:5,10-methylenetetrahydromethanopterin reductase